MTDIFCPANSVCCVDQSSFSNTSDLVTHY